jgi:flagellar biosynthesis/type III secretory pathway M-ring protein FliF/YscJ
MQENNIPQVVKTSVNTWPKNKKMLLVLVGVILVVTVFSVLYIAVIYPSN